MTGAAPIINTTEKTEKTRQLTDHVDIISGMKSEIPRKSFRNARWADGAQGTRLLERQE